MAFNSPLFMLFIAVCAAIHGALPQRVQNPFLLAASMVCYFWAAPQYGVLLLGTVALVYFGARWIDQAQDTPVRRRRMWLVIGPLLAVLGLFKYFNFFMGSAGSLLGWFGIAWQPPVLGWILPLGISFYTFQAIGYCADVSGRKMLPERNFVDFALFISFFPQIMSGPIGRAGELLPQYKRHRPFVYGETLYGLRRFLLGLFKKTVVADGLGLLVDAAYAQLRDYSGAVLLFAAFGYAVQLYFDFAGYTDMAVGAARLFGVKLRENFLAPYFAFDPAGFWSRWHISLTSWLRDYIYIPLGGNRRGFPRKLFNIALVFLISGLWHGASWRFVAWGGLHAFARVGQELLRRCRPPKAPGHGFAAILGAAGMFCFAAFGFVLFRAASFADAAYLWGAMFRLGGAAEQFSALWASASPGITLGRTYTLLYFGLLGPSLLLAFWFDLRLARSVGRRDGTPLLEPLGGIRPHAVRWLAYWYMALSSLLFLFIVKTAAQNAVSFIYFGF